MLGGNKITYYLCFILFKMSISVLQTFTAGECNYRHIKWVAMASAIISPYLSL